MDGKVVVVTGGTCCHPRCLRRLNRSMAPGASGIGELVANTLAVRGVTVAVLDVNPIITENCEHQVSCVYARLTWLPHPDNIAYYKCDVSKWEEVEAAAKKIREEVRSLT